MDRRTFLLKTSPVTVIGLSGCLGGPIEGGRQKGPLVVSFSSNFTFFDGISSCIALNQENASFVKITHQSGEDLSTENLYIVGENLAYPDCSNAITGRVPLGTASNAGPNVTLTEGDSFKLNLDESKEPRAAELELIWADGEDAKVMYDTEGPDA